MSENKIKSVLTEEELQNVSGGVKPQSPQGPQVAITCSHCKREFASLDELKAHEATCNLNPKDNSNQFINNAI